MGKEQATILFLDAPGGTGKTFLINLILAEIGTENEICLPWLHRESQLHYWMAEEQPIQD